MAFGDYAIDSVGAVYGDKYKLNPLKNYYDGDGFVNSCIDPGGRTFESHGYVYKLNPIKNVADGDGFVDSFVDPAGRTLEGNGYAYKLNPIKNLADGDGFVDSFIDPATSTLKANGVKCYLNPIQEVIDGRQPDDNVTTMQKVLDPGLTTLTANVFDDPDDANVANWVLNPIGTALGKLFG